MRYVELPETVVKDIRKYTVMRKKRDTKIGEISDLYENLITTISSIAEDRVLNYWLDHDEEDLQIDPVDLRASAVNIAEQTVEVYVHKIEDEACRNVLKFLFSDLDAAAAADEEEDNEEQGDAQ